MIHFLLLLCCICVLFVVLFILFLIWLFSISINVVGYPFCIAICVIVFISCLKGSYLKGYYNITKTKSDLTTDDYA
jgi:hypothetical protein